MDFSTVLQLVREFGDTKFSLLLAVLATAFVVWKLRGHWEKLATKEEVAAQDKKLEAHKLVMYNESLILESNVTGTLAKYQKSLDEHEAKDDKRFQTLDGSIVPQFNTMNKKVESARRSLSRIEGALNIPPEPEMPE